LVADFNMKLAAQSMQVTPSSEHLWQFLVMHETTSEWVNT